MSFSVSAVWQNMQLEDYENQPYLYNGDPAWGELVTEIWMDKWLPKRFYILGLFTLLTCSTPESKDKEINWVKPRKLIKAAERLKRRLNNNSNFINSILKIYSKYAIGIESPPVGANNGDGACKYAISMTEKIYEKSEADISRSIPPLHEPRAWTRKDTCRQ